MNQDHIDIIEEDDVHKFIQWYNTLPCDNGYIDISYMLYGHVSPIQLIIGYLILRRAVRILRYIVSRQCSWVGRFSFGRYLLDRMTKYSSGKKLYGMLCIPENMTDKYELECRTRHIGIYPRLGMMYHPDISIHTYRSV